MAERWWSLAGSVRLRTTVAAVLVVGVALLVGAVGLVLATRYSLTSDVRNAAELRAGEVAAVLEAGTEPGRLAVGDEEEMVIQVLDGAGRVVAASENVEGVDAVADLKPGGSAEIAAPVDDGRFLAVAVGADTAGGDLTVLVARSLDPVDESTGVVTGLLAFGLPVLLLVVAGTTWRVVGRALAPVDAIRREVDEISAAALHRRVPKPPGRDEIARLAATMNRMLDRLETAQARQRRFVSDASHELRSPVAAIRQHAAVALAHPDRGAGLAENVLAEGLRVQRLVEDLLLLARADEHSLQLRRRPVDLDDLVFTEARRLRGDGAPELDASAVSAGRVSGEAGSLRRVVRNLVENAARHARSRVSLALTETDGHVLLRVDDDGPGIPVAERERVFERFVRLDDARARDGGGSGLGLAIVAELVTAHGGTVTIADSPLGGARVEVRLPRLDVQPGVR